MSEASPSSQLGKLIIVSGPSGVGKGTVLRRLFATGEFPLIWSVSATTRAPRQGERDGIDYRFLSREDFLARQANGEFLETAEVFAGGDLYGTLREPVEEAIRCGKWIVLEIDVRGAMQALEVFPEAETIFILPPSREELLARLVGRGSESPESVARRQARADAELQLADRYKKRIVNDQIDRAVCELAAYLRSF